MRRFLVLLLAIPLLLPAAPAATAPSAESYCLPTDRTACGLLALPVGAPSAIVVIAHGYGHTSASHKSHLEHLAAQGYAAVAMDYRGAGFPLRAGATDTIGATLDLTARFPDVPVVLYSVSMGTAVAGIVLAELPVFDHWVSNEGLSMLHETWAGASALAPGSPFAAQAKADIEAECGGAPVVAPTCYAQRSAALRAGEFRGLRGAILTHGVNDGIVPYDQGRELAEALRANGIVTDFHTVLRGEHGGEGTTITGYAGVQVDGAAGHGSESNDAHTLTALSFDLLDRLLAGEVPTGREVVVDRT